MADKLNQTWDQCLFNLGKKVSAGGVVGFALSFAFKRRVPFTTYGAGLGAGYAYLQCNRKFEAVEKDRTKVK